MTILVLDELEVHFGFLYGLVLTVVSGAATLACVFFLDRGRTIAGAAATTSQKIEIKTIPTGVASGRAPGRN